MTIPGYEAAYVDLANWMLCSSHGPTLWLTQVMRLLGQFDLFNAQSALAFVHLGLVAVADNIEPEGWARVSGYATYM